MQVHLENDSGLSPFITDTNFPGREVNKYFQFTYALIIILHCISKNKVWIKKTKSGGGFINMEQTANIYLQEKEP